MGFIKTLVGWFFTYPPYRDLTAEQSEGVVALLALALYADGEPHDTEREELERELTGVPHYWADEARLRSIVDDTIARFRLEDFEAHVREVAPRVSELDAEFILTGAAFVCHGDRLLTDIERANLAVMGRVLGVEQAVIERILSDPEGHSRAMFETGDDGPATG